MIMKVLELRNVNKIYDSAEVKVHAVNNVTMDFSEAEFVAIVGPSGSGKTTLLNMIGGLDMPTSGEIIIGGTNLSKLKSSQLIDFRLRNIGFVFQSYNLIPVLTARENKSGAGSSGISINNPQFTINAGGSTTMDAKAFAQQLYREFTKKLTEETRRA